MNMVLEHQWDNNPGNRLCVRAVVAWIANTKIPYNPGCGCREANKMLKLENIG
jgi:hypothetical protein